LRATSDVFEGLMRNIPGLNFSSFYNNNGKKAGRYVFDGSKWSFSSN